ncbi:MAG: gamma-butyrobetaine hydroxylase-like domain-containing protein [Terriglobales bacterium]
MPSAIPKHVRVNQTAGTGMEIDWADGHSSHYKFQYLRDACPCALCKEERDASGADFGDPPKPKPGGLPMYRDPARPTKVEGVGKYAISFNWSDGHTSGIYSWEFLRMVCPCEECKAVRAAGGKLNTGGGSILD